MPARNWKIDGGALHLVSLYFLFVCFFLVYFVVVVVVVFVF